MSESWIELTDFKLTTDFNMEKKQSTRQCVFVKPWASVPDKGTSGPQQRDVCFASYANKVVQIKRNIHQLFNK